jgi:hypothetical protein
MLEITQKPIFAATFVVSVPVAKRKDDHKTGDPGKVDNRQRKSVIRRKLHIGPERLEEISDFFSGYQA